MKNFDTWYENLIQTAKEKGAAHWFNLDDKESYRDYFNAGSTAEDVIHETGTYIQEDGILVEE
jgi:hypothetical protein